MAHKTPLAAWLYLNRSKLDPKFTEFKGTGEFLPGLFDFSTRITWNGVELEGRGVDERREIAFEKSVAECIERIICVEKNITSVGLAVSGEGHNPDSHARFEALERYYLNEHLQKRTYLKKIEFKNNLVETFLSSTPDCNVEFFKMLTPNHLHGLVCRISGANRNAFGFALSESSHDSERRSFLEAIPSFAWLKTNADAEMKNQNIPWQISNDFISNISPLLGDSSTQHLQNLIIPNLVFEKIDYSKIKILNTLSMNSVRYTAIASESELCL
ncbi:MAG: hypothetical protein JNM24_14770 [Bdellovibrionaceae bacterium]|nr:hypothetical protein [Pseudobdellovibrionaceae bacterium]